MSRSNPTEDAIHPCKRWHEWDGKAGKVKYYDKEKKENITVDLPFKFVLLDRLSVIKGWHKKSNSGITSNEVKDMRRETLTVRSFKGGIIAEGFYDDIKDTIVANGGHYTVNLYVAARDGDGPLEIASLQLKGASCGAWMEFFKLKRKEIYSKAVEIHEYKEEKNGDLTYRVPQFKVCSLSDDTDQVAKDLDKELQAYLKSYFGQVQQSEPEPPQSKIDDGEIPF